MLFSKYISANILGTRLLCRFNVYEEDFLGERTSVLANFCCSRLWLEFSFVHSCQLLRTGDIRGMSVNRSVNRYVRSELTGDLRPRMAV